MACLQQFLVTTIIILLVNAGRLLAYVYDDLDENEMHPSFKEDFLKRSQVFTREEEHTNEFWLNLGKEYVKKQKQQTQNRNVAKNVILFVGSGMGLTTLVAARNYIGGENTKLSFEEFPYVGLSKTYSVDKIVADAGSTATASLCGIKANYGTVGVNGAILRNDCSGMKNITNHISSIAKWAMASHKSAGFVTTARVTHAAPSGIYAHTANKLWESNNDVEQACGANHGLADTAYQLIYGNVGSKLKVVMGGGKSLFLDKTLYSEGRRSDGRNLIQDYQKQSPKNMFVETKQQLEKLDVKQTQRLMGLFHVDHLDYHLESLTKTNNTQPSLKVMTKKALEIMQQQNEAGYFLFIEGGKINMAHQENKARLAIDETKEFSEAVDLARQMTNEQDTLIVVTSDHSSSFSVAGYQDRGSDIFSLLSSFRTKDETPFSPISYANGKGYHKHFNVVDNKRVDPYVILKGNYNDLFPATVPLISETNSGEDVAVFASGPWSHLFTGVYEQNALPHMMAYAACIGKGLKACDTI